MVQERVELYEWGRKIKLFSYIYIREFTTRALSTDGHCCCCCLTFYVILPFLCCVDILYNTMSSFKGFTFQEPAKTSKEDEDKQVSELTFQLSQISAQDEEGSRLASYQAYRSPLSSRSLSETQEMRRLKALELQKQVCMQTKYR